MTRLILVRHGQTLWNSSGKIQGHSDIELSPLGIRQAELVAERLADEKVVAVYASDLNRAFNTAIPIAKRHSHSVIKVPEIREANFGQWEGLIYEEIEARWPGMFEQFLTHADELEIPGGESFRELKNRAYIAVQELIAKHEKETIVVVSHGGTICTIICSILNMHLNDVWSIRIDNTAVNIIDYHNGRPTIKLINDTHHLKALK